jgi:RNA polymerase sigma-70 factor (ECF subfamily)
MQKASSSNLSSQVNEKFLVKNFIGGDEKAFESLFKAHYQMLKKVAHFITQDAEQCEEIVHDVFINIWQKRQNINPEASFKNYLITAVRNRCFNHLKAKKQTQSIDNDESWVEELVADTYTDTKAQVRDVQKAIDTAIDKLPEQCRLIFQLSRYEGMSYKEIAEALDIAPKTVENQIGRALKFLKTDLKDFLPSFLIFILLEIN